MTMKVFPGLFILIMFTGCGQTTDQPATEIPMTASPYHTFLKEEHLQPDFDKTTFDTLHSWDLGWELLDPINIAKNDTHEITLSRRFSPGQKALYFFWYLDAEVTNGGFIQFYWNGYRKYIPPILDGLQLIGDTAMLELVRKADKEYLRNEKMFLSEKENDDWQPLYDTLTNFEAYDSIYYELHDQTMALIEQYARRNPGEFVKLR